MAEKKVYLGSQGPYLFDDGDTLDDPDGDFSGQGQVGIVSNSQVVATEFIGIPVSSISVTDIDDPSTELNPLSASTVGGLIAVYQAVGSANDEFTMYLWDTDAAAENVPYTVDGDGGTWIAVSGKYQNGDVNLTGTVNLSSLTASTSLVLDGSKNIASFTKETHIADASVAHATASFGEVNSALNALGTIINSILSVLENAQLVNTS